MVEAGLYSPRRRYHSAGCNRLIDICCQIVLSSEPGPVLEVEAAPALIESVGAGKVVRQDNDNTPWVVIVASADKANST
jgi:hypothetical protein